VDIDDRLDWQGVAHLGKAEAGRRRGKEKERERDSHRELLSYTFPR